MGVRPLRLALWLPPLVLMGAIFALSAQPSLDSGLGWIDHVGRKLIHFGEYALLCFLWWRALASVTTPRRAALLAFLIASAREEPSYALHPLVPAVDFALLLLLELVAPDSLGGVRLAALFLIAAHSHFQGERLGLMIAAGGATALVVGSAVRGDAPFDSDVLAFYEAVFVLASLATAVVVGLLRSSESASRLRARELSRRTMQAESEVRRRVAESIHDGPVQELIGLDMILSAAGSEADGQRVGHL